MGFEKFSFFGASCSCVLEEHHEAIIEAAKTIPEGTVSAAVASRQAAMREYSERGGEASVTRHEIARKFDRCVDGLDRVWNTAAKSC